MASDEPELPEAEPDRFFCTCCLVGDITRSDEDRCCLMCGYDLVSLTDLRSLLSAHGLHIVDAKDWAVLEACSAFQTEALDGSLMHVPCTLQDRKRQAEISWTWCQAELARREKAGG